MSTEETNRVAQGPKRNLGRNIIEAILTAGILLFGFVIFSYYREKANSDVALDRYISLRGYELSYLQTYHYLLIFFWAMVGILFLALATKLHENWEYRDFKRMLANQRKEKKALKKKP